MRLEQSFEVPVPVAQAWAVLLDLELVAPCMPGATLTSFDGNAFTGTVKVKLGPISLAYRGQGRITERDEPGRRIAFVAQGQDSRGAGGASARVSAVLHSSTDGTATNVKVVTDLDISGKAAQFGRGLIADVSGKVIRQFADNLAATIAAGAVPSASAAPAAPVAEPPSVPAPAASPELSPIPAGEPLAVVAPIPAHAPAAVVDAVAAAEPPALAPVFSEPAAAPPPPPAPVMPVFPPPPADWERSSDAPEPAATPEPVAAVAEPEPYLPPTPAHSAPPEYHPLALMDPDPVPAQPEPSAPPVSTVVPQPTPAAEVPAAGAGLRRPPVEAEPLDLLAVSGAKGVMRKAAPVLIIVGLVVVGLVVWLLVR
jgi:carbon monoxide dehydrogenase subunit G